mmetsp:Transcript_5305/g.17282  ORF Transcript_5305/g.17282 Transcript_5305/m.17282 type:complete len:354 (+) Transcript_5305:608-1669(+)
MSYSATVCEAQEKGVPQCTPPSIPTSSLLPSRCSCRAVVPRTGSGTEPTKARRALGGRSIHKSPPPARRTSEPPTASGPGSILTSHKWTCPAVSEAEAAKKPPSAAMATIGDLAAGGGTAERMACESTSSSRRRPARAHSSCRWSALERSGCSRTGEGGWSGSGGRSSSALVPPAAPASESTSHRRTAPSVEADAACDSPSRTHDEMGAAWPRSEQRSERSSRLKRWRLPSPPPVSTAASLVSIEETPPACSSSLPWLLLSEQMRRRRSIDHSRTAPPSAEISNPSPSYLAARTPGAVAKPPPPSAAAAAAAVFAPSSTCSPRFAAPASPRALSHSMRKSFPSSTARRRRGSN